MSFFGSRGITLAPDAWRDQVFSRTLPFYLFDLPFYSDVLGFLFVLAILCALVFWATARGWQLVERFQLDRLSRRSTLDLGLAHCCCRVPAAPDSSAWSSQYCCVVLLLGCFLATTNFYLILMRS